MNAAWRTMITGLVLAAAVSCGVREEPGAAPPAPDTTPSPVASDTVEWIARGTEPFWAVTVTREGIQFQEPDRPEGVRGEFAPATREQGRLVWRTTLQDSVTLPLELTIEEKPCSDGMSDRSYSFAAIVQVGNRTLRGCAEKR